MANSNVTLRAINPITNCYIYLPPQKKKKTLSLSLSLSEFKLPTTTLKKASRRCPNQETLVQAKMIIKGRESYQIFNKKKKETTETGSETQGHTDPTMRTHNDVNSGSELGN